MNKKAYVVAMVGVLAVSAALPWLGQATGQVESEYNNLVPLWADFPWMNMTGGLLNNGTYAHVHIQNLTQTQGTLLTLEDPNGLPSLTATVQPGAVAFFADANLAINGTWNIKDALGTIITRFNVTVWDGETTPSTDAPALVTLFPDVEDFIDDVLDAYGLTAAPLEKVQGKMEAKHDAFTATAEAYNEDIALDGDAAYFIAFEGTDQLYALSGDAVTRLMHVVSQFTSTFGPSTACASFSTTPQVGIVPKFGCLMVFVDANEDYRGVGYTDHCPAWGNIQIRAVFGENPEPILKQGCDFLEFSTTT